MVYFNSERQNINKNIQKTAFYNSYELICICRGKKVFEPLAKHDLVLCGITLVGKHRRQIFLVVGHQVYTHLRRDFDPLLFADPLQILKVAFSMRGNEVQAQYSTVHGPIHTPLDAVESSCTLGRETAPKHNVSTSMLDGGDGVHFQHSSPSKCGKSS